MRKTSSPSFFDVDWLQRFQAPLAAHGDMARAGQMVAARLVEAPRQRHSREENIQIKAGTLAGKEAAAKKLRRAGRRRISRPTTVTSITLPR